MATQKPSAEAALYAHDVELLTTQRTESAPKRQSVRAVEGGTLPSLVIALCGSERGIFRVIASDNIPFVEAEKRVPKPTPSGMSFSRVVMGGTQAPRERQPRVERATQTVEMKSVGVQAVCSTSDASTEAKNPGMIDMECQTRRTTYDFYDSKEGCWRTRDGAVFDGVPTSLPSPFDKEDPWVQSGHTHIYIPEDTLDTSSGESMESEDEGKVLTGRPKSIQRPPASLKPSSRSATGRSRSPVKPP